MVPIGSKKVLLDCEGQRLEKEALKIKEPLSPAYYPDDLKKT